MRRVFMCNKFTQREVCLMNQLRKLWEQHVYWTRFFIISTASDLNDLELVTKRLLQNPGDFANLLRTYYGARKAEQFKELFTQHLLIAADLVNAAKGQVKDKADDARSRWYKNADDIARFFANINPFWCEEKWRTMLHSHLEMTEKEAVLYLEGNYASSIKIFESIEEQALKMADYMFCGIAKQCLL